jgi:calcium/proton exchanger cax
MKNPKGMRNCPKKGPGGRPACTLPVLDITKSRLLLASGLVAISAEFLVDSIDGMVKGSGVSETFVGLILLPIVGNAAEVQDFS